MSDRRAGFTLVEVVLASALFGMLVVGLLSAYTFGQQSSQSAGSRQRALVLADEGMEAVRSIRDGNFSVLTNGTYGLGIASNHWTLVGTPDVVDGFTRQITITSVSANQKQITTTITWPETPQRSGTVTIASFLSNWRAAVPPPRKGGILAYGDGGTTTDAIRYKLYDGVTSSWGAATLAADVDGTSVNRAPYYVRVYSSATRNEKIMLSRHYNGTTQYIYGQVFNGTTWGSVQLLSSWNSATNLNAKNVDGAYLANGDFMVVYSDNTITPKMRVWNGTVWGAVVNTRSVTNAPNTIITRTRPGTNEVMLSVLTQGSRTNTMYFNGGTYVLANWSAVTSHATLTTDPNKEIIDFAWDVKTPTIGVLIYADAVAATSFRGKVWTANGTGGGVWGAATTSPVTGAAIGALSLTARPGADEFIGCDKTGAASPSIVCYKVTSAAVISSPTNLTITAATDTGIQPSSGVAYELSGTNGLAIYSDNTTTPKLKKYNPGSTTWDAAATSLTALSVAPKVVVAVPHSQSDDIMILLSNASLGLATDVWNGTTHALYGAPAGNTLTSQSSNGALITSQWFDFAWDKF